MIQFSTLIKRFRSRHGLSQAQAGAALDVSPRSLQGWELGRPARPFTQTVILSRMESYKPSPVKSRR